MRIVRKTLGAVMGVLLVVAAGVLIAGVGATLTERTASAQGESPRVSRDIHFGNNFPAQASAARGELFLKYGTTPGLYRAVGSGGSYGGGAWEPAFGRYITGSASLDFAQALANTCETKTLTVTGLTNDGSWTLDYGVPHALANANATASFTVWGSATNTASVRRCVISADSGDPAAASVRVTGTKL